MTQTDVGQQDEAHLNVLRLLESQPHLSQRDLADALGVSLGKVNYCVRALVGKGFVKINNFRRSRNKLGYAYLLTPTGLEAKAKLARSFLARKQCEYDTLRSEIERLQKEIAQAGERPAHPKASSSSP